MISLKELSRSAIGISIVYLVTAVLPPIKIGPGFFNLSDVAIMLIAFMYGPKVGVLSAVGAALGDVTLGFLTYIPFTLLTKTFTAYMIGKYKTQFISNSASRVFIPTMTMIYMIFSYGIHDWFVLDQFWVWPHIFGNLIQGVVAIVLFNLFVTSRFGGKHN